MNNLINPANSAVLGNKRFSQSMPAANSDVLEILLQLNTLFAKKIFGKKSTRATSKKKVNENPDETFVEIDDNTPEWIEFLQKELSPRRIDLGPRDEDFKPWKKGSILDELNSEKGNLSKDSLRDILLKDRKGSQLFYDYQQLAKTNWFSFPYNKRLVLRTNNNNFIYPDVAAYLVSYAYFVKGIGNLNGIVNFINEQDNGFRAIDHYILVSATRKLIDSVNLDFKNLNGDDNSFYTFLSENDISFQSSGFKQQVLGMVNNYLSNDQYSDLINTWNENKEHTQINENQNPELYNRVITLLKSYNSNNFSIIEDKGIEALMPAIIMQALGQMYSNSSSLPSYSTFVSTADDFNVDFIEDDQTVTEVNIQNVKCAAQLYYAMTIGDELEVFNAVNYLTNNYLVRGGMEIKDKRLRENLQMYVFSNKFRDTSGREMDKTRPAERQMFYRQVFNFGTAPVTDNLIINSEFTRLWKVLILESAKYLERVQDSPTQVSFVSKQNVMQTVEDLQYNLSTHCTGMVNVITPIIYQELNFVIREILNHEEIRKQVVPSGGSWWRVVEALYSSMRTRRSKTTALNNKAKTGYEILKQIADFNPSTFEDDDVFIQFISSVDNFITTQSILQESMVDQIKKLEPSGPEPDDDAGMVSLNGKAAPVAAGADEWDF